MKLTADTTARTLIVESDGERRTLELFSPGGFEAISALWLTIGWDQKYPYTFSWFGRPIIQLPEDLIRTQEAIWRLRPDVIVETGVAHGGSLVFYASLCKAIGHGRVVGVDVEIRAHNRAAIEAHPLAAHIELIEGDSVAPDTVATVRDTVGDAATVLVLLDSNHTKAHVRAELDAYHALVTPGSYIVATDGIMALVAQAPRGEPRWAEDNPARAAAEFLESHPEFELEQPPWPFNESPLNANVTHWPNAWLRRKGPA